MSIRLARQEAPEEVKPPQVYHDLGRAQGPVNPLDTETLLNFRAGPFLPNTEKHSQRRAIDTYFSVKDECADYISGKSQFDELSPNCKLVVLAAPIHTRGANVMKWCGRMDSGEIEKKAVKLTIVIERESFKHDIKKYDQALAGSLYRTGLQMIKVSALGVATTVGMLFAGALVGLPQQTTIGMGLAVLSITGTKLLSCMVRFAFDKASRLRFTKDLNKLLSDPRLIQERIADIKKPTYFDLTKSDG